VKTAEGRKRMKYIFIFLSSVFIASVSQTMLKVSAGKHYDNPLREYLNLRVIAAYCLFFLSSLITVLAYRYVPLSMGPVLESSGYIFVAVLSFLFLKEHIGKKTILGLVLIFAGILVFSI
jgi:drug/metabolite transporter (DMT)-like permease